MLEDLRPLWERSDEHRKTISDLQIRQAVHQEMLNTHAAQIAQITKDSSERHGELKTLMSQLSTKFDTVIEEHNLEKGAAGYRRWLVPILVALLGVAVSMGIIK